MQTSHRARLHRNPAYDAGSAETSPNGQFRIMTFHSVRVTFENDKHGEATGTLVRKGKLTGSYCTLIYVIFKYMIDYTKARKWSWRMQIRIRKTDCRGFFEDNILNLPRLREMWINYNLELQPLSDRGSTVFKLCYKLEVRWFDPRWCHWNFSLT